MTAKRVFQATACGREEEYRKNHNLMEEHGYQSKMWNLPMSVRL